MIFMRLSLYCLCLETVFVQWLGRRSAGKCLAFAVESLSSWFIDVHSHLSSGVAQAGARCWSEQRIFPTVSFFPWLSFLVTSYLLEVTITFRLLFGIPATCSTHPQISAIPSLQIVVEFLLAHCRLYLLAFFFCALYQKNKVWDLMGSCLNQVPLILILTQCSI